ncbi:hypothetical protein COCNU_10G003280 [Cocos nucifera]|uniref:Uncharacterized protein n=1 Tax=Cocos nucifera TaxID=13894 RepID=A0A8K0N8N4_COCNU|nr:hypothetical protein COCNU_10G003280 [Cocos nucifera]
MVEKIYSAVAIESNGSILPASVLKNSFQKRELCYPHRSLLHRSPQSEMGK